MPSIKKANVSSNLVHASILASSVVSPIPSSIVQREQTTSKSQTKISSAQSSMQSTGTEVVTPVKANILVRFLTGYDEDLKKYLSNGFLKGFRINFEGPQQFRVSRNLKSAFQHPDILQEKLNKEIMAGK